MATRTQTDRPVPKDTQPVVVQPPVPQPFAAVAEDGVDAPSRKMRKLPRRKPGTMGRMLKDGQARRKAAMEAVKRPSTPIDWSAFEDSESSEV